MQAVTEAVPALASEHAAEATRRAIDGWRVGSTRRDELGSREDRQLEPERTHRVGLEERRERGRPELAPHHGSGLEHLSLAVAQAIEPGAQQRMQVGRKPDQTSLCRCRA